MDQFPDERGRGRLIRRTKGGMNTALYAICDNQGRPLNLFVTAGQRCEIMSGRLKDWRRVATRYDRSRRSSSQPSHWLATVIYWL